MDMENKFIELSDNKILIDFALDCKCRTTITLKSLISSSPIAFKIQTSSPDKFLVNPSSGIIPPLSSAALQIVLKPQPHPPPNFPRSPSDRFLVKIAAAHDLTADDLESARSTVDLVNRWFNSAPHRPTYDVKLKVYFVGSFLLAQAAGAGEFEAAKGIIKRQRSVVSKLPVGEAELLYRVAAPYPDIKELLLESGLRVDGRRKIHDNVRSTAAQPHHGAGVDPTTGNVDRFRFRTAINGQPRDEEVLQASRLGDINTLESLLEQGARTSFTDQYGLTPLHAAAILGHKDAVAMLVESGANISRRDAEGHTPLHLAVQGGSIQTVEYLVLRGADVNVITVNGATPLSISRCMEHDEIAQFLMARGAEC